MQGYRRIYPNKGAVLLDGGQNSKFEKALIEDNESPDCMNVIFTNGAVETRGGISKVNTAPIGSFVGDALYTRRTLQGAETMVAFAGGTAWTLTGTSFITIPSAQSVFTAGIRVHSAQMENHIFFGNGGVIPYKYNGTDFTRHGVYPATTTMTVATAPTGSALSGEFRYAMTNVNSNLVESDLSPLTTTLTVAVQNGRLTNIPVAPQSHGVSTRRLYRTESSGVVFKRLATLNDNTTTTYDDAILDASLGATAPTDQGVPPLYSAIVYCLNRLFAIDPSTGFVHYSEVNEPYTWKATSFIPPSDLASDIAKSLSVYDNSLIIGCEKSVHILYMPSATPTDWRLIKSKSQFGNKSPFVNLDYNNKQLFSGMQNGKLAGFAALSGDTTEPSSTLLTISSAGGETKSERIEPDVFDMVESFVGNFSGVVFKNKAYIAVTKGSAQTTNNRVYCMDFSISRPNKNQKEVWVPFSGWNAAQFTIYDGQLYFISSTTNGHVYKHDPTIYNDDGAAINSYFWTKEFSGYPEDTNSFKDFRYLNFLVENSGDYFMNVHYRADSDIGDGNLSQVDLDPGGSLWGSMRWGLDNWGGGSSQKEVRLYLGTTRGKRIQFRFSNQNTVNQKFKVSRLNFAYNNKGER